MRQVAIVQEATATADLLMLKVREPGRSSHVFIAALGGATAVGLVDPERRRAAWGGKLPPGATRRRAAEGPLVGARIVALEPDAIVLERDSRLLEITRSADGLAVRVRDGESEATFPGASEEVRDGWLAAGDRLLTALERASLERLRSDALRIVDRGRVTLARRAAAVRGDLGKMEVARALAEQAPWLIAEAARTPRGARSLTVTDWSSGEAIPISIALDPSRHPREQVEATFRKAKRLRAGRAVAEARLGACLELDATLACAADAIREGATAHEVADALAAAKRAAPREVSLAPAEAAARPRAAAPPRRPFRSFVSRSGTTILVGRGARDNDELTLRVASPNDFWIHAKGKKGAHVIVRSRKGASLPTEDLLDAAHLAAHFSEARDETLVEVQHAERRHLRKPRDSAPGFVAVDRERVLSLRVDRERLADLLARESLD